MEKKLIVIAGPTASGKTALAIKLAKYFQTEIISCDSRQVFKEMEIGTAKPSKAELSEVKHHFINSHTISQRFSAGDFEKQGLVLLESLFKSLDTVIMVGGSGLYIRALCEGLDDFPTIDDSIRESLNNELNQFGIEHLKEELKQKDPEYYTQLDLSNSQRLIRALEICRGTGKPISSFRSNAALKRNFKVVKIGLDLPRELLYDRINRRVDIMIENGLIDEVSSLIPQKHLNALNTVGYTELFDYFSGTCTKEEAIELIKRNTRRYAKRQITWFKKEKGLIWKDIFNYQAILNTVEN